MGVALDRVLGKLDSVKPLASGGYVARCPSHDDRYQSLQISERPDLSVGVQYRDRDELVALGIHVHSRTGFPALLLPMFRATGEPISAQFKAAKPTTIKGRSVKVVYTGAALGEFVAAQTRHHTGESFR